jgi:hypothetical protein
MTATLTFAQWLHIPFLLSTDKKWRLHGVLQDSGDQDNPSLYNPRQIWNNFPIRVSTKNGGRMEGFTSPICSVEKDG